MRHNVRNTRYIRFDTENPNEGAFFIVVSVDHLLKNEQYNFFYPSFGLLPFERIIRNLIPFSNCSFEGIKIGFLVSFAYTVLLGLPRIVISCIIGAVIQYIYFKHA